MSAIPLETSNGTAYVHETDYVADTILVSFTGQKADAAPVPFLWTVDTTEQAVIDGIEAWIADPDLTVEKNGHGLIINTGVPSHPQAEITGHDCDNDKMQFRWINGPHTGALAEDFEFTTNSTTTELVNAVLAMLPSGG